jgi:hypothetical protein
MVSCLTPKTEDRPQKEREREREKERKRERERERERKKERKRERERERERERKRDAPSAMATVCPDLGFRLLKQTTAKRNSKVDGDEMSLCTLGRR